MSDGSKIEWTDATWNPITGCTKVSPGCDHCYAETFAERFRGTPGHHFERGFDVQLRPEKLDQPLGWKRPRRIFVNSMSDLSHDQVPDDYIARVFAVMALAPQHTFQILTKRPGRMRSLLSNPDFITEVRDQHMAAQPVAIPVPRWPLPNVGLGVSAEDQKWAGVRIPVLLDTPAAFRFVSAEPLLGPVVLDPEWLAPTAIVCGRSPEWTLQDSQAMAVLPRSAVRMSAAAPGNEAPGRIDWVIVGGESGRGARPMHPDWVRSIRSQCQHAGVAFHFKQWGSHHPDGSRGNKHATGRVLDGRTWDEFPAVGND